MPRERIELTSLYLQNSALTTKQSRLKLYILAYFYIINFSLILKYKLNNR